jgi:hypothetical protein
MTALEPPPGRTLPPHRRAAARRQLESIVAQPAGHHRRRLGIIAGAAAVAVIGTGAGTAVYLQSQPVTNKTSARCYTVASLAGGPNFQGPTIAHAAPPGGKAQVDNALSVCAALWRQGFLRPGSRGMAQPGGATANHPVPPLVACTMPDGTAAVFPGNSHTCAHLGLPRAARR